MMSTYSGIMVCDYQKYEYRFSKGKVLTFRHEEPFDHHYLYRGSVDNKMLCVIMVKKNSRLDWRMHLSTTGGKSEYSPFNSMHRGKSIFLSQVFFKER